MKDVAARAKVSVGTVSNVLNRPEVVAERTRRRVLTAIEDLGFVRNESARQLRAGRSRTLAYVVLDAANPFFTDVERGITAAADVQRLAVYLCNANQNADRQAAFLDLLEEQRVEGVLITPADPTDDRLWRLPQRGTPVVLVDAFSPDHCCVTVNDVLGGELAATHLIDAGHKRIGFIGGPMTLPQVAERLEGMRRAAAQRDLEPVTVIETQSLDVDEGRRAGARLAGRPASERPTAVLCGNDLLALGLLQQTLRLGLRVPEDLAIVGYDDIEFAEASAVPITSVAQPRHELGHTAAQMVLEEARGAAGHEHRHVSFAPELVVRASSRLTRS
jgi:LacI family transcriptional regulator